MSLGAPSLHRAAADPLAGRRAAAHSAYGSHAARSNGGVLKEGYPQIIHL